MAKLLTLGQYRARALLGKMGEPSDLVKRAREDIGAFGEYLLGYQPAAHHRVWLKAIQTGQDSQVLNCIAGPDTRISAPRGSAKTTWISIVAAWVIGKNSDVRIILTSYSDEIALSISVYVKSLIESAKYQEVFPWVMPSDRWRDGAWTVRRSRFLKDPTVLAVGMAGGIASRRADLVLIDDPIKSSKQIFRPEIREDMRLWWSEVLKPCRVPGSRAIVLSTRYRRDDIHGTTFNEENGWQVISQKAIQVGEDGQEVSYWPEYVSLGELQRLREENPKAFASQYQNDPLADSGALVQLDWIKKGAVTTILDMVVLAIDLAASQREGADYTALAPVGRLGNRFFTLRPKKGRWTLDQTIREIFTMAEELGERSKQVLIICEAVAYQSAFVTELKRRSQVEDVWAVIEPIPSKSFKPRGNKEERLFGATGVLEAGAMVFESGTEELIEQLLNFGLMEHDDLADAWVYAVLRLIGRRKLETFGVQ